jgi:hypothetical protein
MIDSATAKKLLQTIDAIECDLRHLEGRLTSVREMIHREAGLRRSHGLDGRPLPRPAVEVPHDDCPF